MSHLTSIGFPNEILENFTELTDRLKPNTTTSKSGALVQYEYKDSSGAGMIWLSEITFIWFGKENTIAFCPTFIGEVNQMVREPELKIDRQNSDASLYLWVYNNEGEEYPLIVDMPQFLEITTNTDIKSISQLQITLSAYTLETYASEEEYKKADKEKGGNFAPNMFIPSGTFAPYEDPNFVPTAECITYGTVLKSEILINQITQRPFYHFILQTYGAQYDVVAAIDLLPTPPKVGSITGGTFWCSARLI